MERLLLSPSSLAPPPGETATGPPPLLPLLGGVVLPVLALVVNWLVNVWQNAPINPVPTPWHAALIAVVPIANLLAWVALDRGLVYRSRGLGLLNATALGVAGFYSLLFLPITPFAAVAVLYFGLGLLPLAPLISFCATWRLRRRLAAEMPLGTPWAGLALGLALLMAVALPSTLTRVGLAGATSPDPAVARTGRRMLRAYGHATTLWNACHGQSAPATDPVGLALSLGRPVPAGEVREAMYRALGTTCEALPRPQQAGWFDFGNWDEHQGGTVVGATLAGLSLGSSRLDGSVDAAGALSYVEWTLTFRNTQPVPQEARADIHLPAGGVVSRATLWINGEEREAAFGGTAQVREAYQAVVQARRDPLLVTHSGPGRVRLQCFPVPANGEMKVRIGITAPLTLAGGRQPSLTLPRLGEHNFTVTRGGAHALWLASDTPLSGAVSAFRAERTADGHVLRGVLEDAQLQDHGTIQVTTAAAPTAAWASAPPQFAGMRIQQRWRYETPPAPSRVVVVIDGSTAMQPFAGTLGTALDALRSRTKLDVLLAADEPRWLQPPFAAALSEDEFAGGQDNVPALLTALERANATAGSRLVWLHGPQPQLLTGADVLRQVWERQPDATPLRAVALVNGRNVVLQELQDLPAIEAASHVGDLTRWLAMQAAPEGEWRPVRAPLAAAAPLPERQTSTHLARLWAFDEVKRLAQTGARDEAIRLGVAWQLVTPVTGAVVLESQRQYNQAGLRPVEPNSVPTVPEPGTWLLLLVAGVVLAVTWRRGGSPWRTVPR